jgi:hypothetical protein
MKDILKNPLIFYVLVPVLAVLWPAVIWGVYLPGVRSALVRDKGQYAKAQQVIDELLVVDPQRLNFAEEKTGSADFDYATAVQRTAEFCSIGPGNYKLSSGIITTTEGRKSQSATVSLKDVDITKAMRFLSAIQLRWPTLQCTKVTLRKKKGLPDSWEIDFTFKYFY